MRAGLLVLTAVLLFSAMGCARQEQADLDDARARVAVLETDLAQEQGRGAQYQRQLAMLGEQVRRMEADRASLQKQLDDQTAELNKYRAHFGRQKQRAEERKVEAEKKKQEMLEATRKANLPAEYPFRVFDVLYVGRQTHNGETINWGMFSVRNYTAEPLQVRAWSRITQVVRVTVPPNQSLEKIYVPASEDGSLHVETSAGNSQHRWENIPPKP